MRKLQPTRNEQPTENELGTGAARCRDNRKLRQGTRQNVMDGAARTTSGTMEFTHEKEHINDEVQNSPARHSN